MSNQARRPACHMLPTLALLAASGVLALAPMKAEAALVTYTYTGALLSHVGAVFDPYGARVTGTATFDTSLLAPGLTGTLIQDFGGAPGARADFTARLGTTLLAPKPIQYLPAAGLGTVVQYITFSQGQVVDWSLATSFILPPGSYLVPLTSTSAGDRLSPVNGGFTIGSSFSTSVGTWAAAAPAVPLPDMLPVFAAGLASLGWAARRRARQAT